MKNEATALRISQLELSVFLGWPDDERSKKQLVLLDIDIWFGKPPLACKTDHLNDTFCYATLIETIRNSIADRSFHLIEHLAAELYHLIKATLPENSRVIVGVNKFPDVPGLKGGVRFSYWDDVS